jgi:hypothetical protein
VPSTMVKAVKRNYKKGFAQEGLSLQRHFSVSTKFGHVESWCCGRQ